MRVHFFQHVPFEDLGSISHWVEANSHSLSATRFYLNDNLPSVDDIDWLIVMGGPMSVNDEREYPWLVREKRFLEDAITKNKVVLGICLGAQMLANVLGSAVYRNKFKEIGWYPVSRTEEADRSTALSALPRQFEAFHWHGEIFDIPRGAIRIAESEACPNQAFAFGARILGLQFHLESTPASVSALIQNCPGDLVVGRYIQDPETMIANEENFSRINRIMNAILDRL
jgi:GMP synthase-like glutamine amidotransferase